MTTRFATPSLAALLGSVLATAALALATTLPCIPDGKSTDVTSDRPDIDGAGMPPDAEWESGDGSPEGFDEDTLSGDDSLGDATPSANGKSASVTITNVGGTLYGPNGQDVEGPGEDDCLEVYIAWWYRYPIEVERCTPTPGGGVECVTVTIWITDWVQGPTQTVCPC